MAFAKLSDTVRRHELLVLASLLAGLVMALFEMVVAWVTGAGLWTFPGYVAATVFRSLQAGGTLTFTLPHIATGLALHLGLAIAVGGLFAWIGPRLREATGLDAVAETPAYGLLGLGYGLAAFAVAWWGVLPYVNPVMVQGMDPTFLALGHGIWGLSLGVTRKAWNQQAPQVRRTSAAPKATPTPSHKAPSGGTSPTQPSPEPPDEETPGFASVDPEQLHDEPSEPETVEEEPEPVGAASTPEDDDLSPWPDPPDPDEEPAGTEDDASSRGTSTSSLSSARDEEDEAEPVYVTEHARRSLRGLTGSEPELPPVHETLGACLTHVAPGRAVCTLEGEQRLHDATGAVQAGMLASLAELAATVAMRTVAPDSEHVIVTSSIDVEGSLGEGHVVAEAQVTEQAGTTTLAEVEVRDASGQVLVAASFQAATGDEADA